MTTEEIEEANRRNGVSFALGFARAVNEKSDAYSKQVLRDRIERLVEILELAEAGKEVKPKY